MRTKFKSVRTNLYIGADRFMMYDNAQSVSLRDLQKGPTYKNLPRKNDNINIRAEINIISVRILTQSQPINLRIIVETP